MKGPFVWHQHEETDDFFLVLKGYLTIHLRDRDVELDPGRAVRGATWRRALPRRHRGD